MGSILLLFEQLHQQLDAPGGGQVHQGGADDGDHQEGHDLELQNIQIFQGAHNGGNEQHAHAVDEKLGGSLNGTLLHPAAEQQNQQDDEADHTGRQCEGQQRGDPLTGHADEKDHAEFDDQIQNNHLNL